MNEYDIVNSDMILDHISFLVLKNPNFNVGIISDNIRLNEYFFNSLLMNLNSLSPSQIINSQKGYTIQLLNNSSIKFYTKNQNSSLITGMKFNMFVDMFESLNHEWKLTLISTLLSDDSVLYHVIDTYHPTIKYLSYK